MSEGGVEIGALSGRIELEDRLSPALDSAIGRVSAFDEAFGGLGRRMLEYTSSFFTAEIALKAVEEAAEVAGHALRELVIEGSHAADIQTTFERMTKAAGLFSTEILDHMRAATHGMVSDIDLMRDVNQMLAVGLRLTDDNLTKLAEGGFVLAKKSGGDVTDALDKMSGAMTRGYVRSLLLLTGKIDLGAAEDKFAAKLDTTTAHLNEQGKQQAIAEEVLERVGVATAKVGDEQVRLGDAVEQSRASWSNINKDLGIAISNSATLNEGLIAGKDALLAAFGGQQRNLINAVALEVDGLAISTVYLFKYMGEGFQGSKILWEGLKKDAMMAAEGVQLAAIGVDELAKGYLYLAQARTGVDLSFSIHAMNVDIDRLYDGLSKSESKIDEWSQQQISAAVSAGKWDKALEGIVARMEAAKKKTEEHNDVQQRLVASFQGGLPAYEAAEKALGKQAAAHEAAATGANSHSAAEDRLKYVLTESRAEAEKYTKAVENIKSVGDGWKATVASMDQTLVKSIEGYLKAGVSQSDLVAYYGHTTAVIKEQIAQLEVEAERHPELTASIQQHIKALQDEADKYGITSAQVRDIAKAMEDEIKQRTLSIKQLEDSKSRWSQYNDLVVSMSGSTTEKINADVERWLAATIKAHVDAKTDTADFYEWSTKMSGALTDKMIHDELLKNKNSKASADQAALDAKRAYDFALEHADQYHQADIDGYRKTSEAATLAAQNWEHTVGTELDSLNGRAKDLQNTLHAGFSFDVTSQNFTDTARQFRLDPSSAFDLAKKGYSFQEIVEILGSPSSGPLPPPRGPKIPGFKEGGIGDFKEGTLAVLHGKEAILPLEGNMGGLGGGTVNFAPGSIVLNYPIMNDPRARAELGGFINELITDRMKNRGTRLYS